MELSALFTYDEESAFSSTVLTMKDPTPCLSVTMGRRAD
jgi:hypothetical protein